MPTTLRARAEHRAAGVSTQAKQHRDSHWRRNALSLICFAAFAVLVIGLLLTGHQTYNADQLDHGSSTISLRAYLAEGHFWEAVFENWESEFLQMAAYVLLTVYLIQKGSSESKDPETHEAVDDDPRDADLRHNVPWPVRRGGIWLRLYENSLFLAFAVLFVASIIGHALGGVDEHNGELRDHGQAAVSTWAYATSSRFWYESFQNWQSEFLAVFAIVVLSIFLRQRGSPESKPVAAPHGHTGNA
jgi:hypothetical protein